MMWDEANPTLRITWINLKRHEPDQGSGMNLVENIFAPIPDNRKDELIEAILQASNFRIERIVSQGHCSPEGFWYDQNENEWVILLKGSAGLRFDDKEELVVLHPGDYIQIPRHLKHRVEWTDADQETVWLAVHYK